jgi:hypothetical protein
LAGGGDQPNPQQVGKNRAQQARYAGLGMAERRTRVWADVAAWAGDKPVFWFARSLDAVDNALPDEADYKSIAEIDAPSMMGAGGGPGGPGGGAPGMGPMMMGGRGPGGRGPAMAGGPGNLGPRGGHAGGGAATKLRVVRLMLPKPAAEKTRE